MVRSAAAAPNPDPRTAALAERVAQLEAANARLQAAAVATPIAPRPRRRIPWRSIGSAALITIAAVLVPVSIVASWARAELVDEATFVATFAPLAADPAIQQAVTDAAITAIEAQLDLGATTDALFDGIGALGLPPSAEAALGLLREPAAKGLHSLLRSGVEQFVQSELFAQVWTVALQTSHRALVATVAGPSPDSAIVIDRSGQIVLQLGPIVEQISQHLADNGFPLTSLIPSIDASIVVAQSDALALIGTVHAVTTAVGTWVPIFALVLLLTGILVARRRRVAIVGAAIGVAIAAGAFLVAALVGAAFAVSEGVRVGLPGAAVATIVDQLLRGMRESAADLLLIGVLTATLALLLGSARLRTAFLGMNARLASVIGVPAWRDAGWVRFLVGQRALVYAVLIVVPLLLVWFLPLRWPGIVLIAIVALVAWWLVAVVRVGAAPGAAGPAVAADGAVGA